MAIYLKPESIEPGSITIEKLSPAIQDAIDLPSDTLVQPNNEIWYTTSDNTMVNIHFGGENGGEENDGQFTEANSIETFGAIMTDHYYNDGKGVIKFDRDVTLVYDWTFMGCSKLTSIQLPQTVTRCGWLAFAGCSLKTFTISENMSMGGESLSGFDGVLTIKNQSILGYYSNRFYPNGSSMAGSEDAWLSGFKGSIVVAEGITTIDDWTFADLSVVKEIVIPSTVTSIGTKAFKDTSCKIILNSQLLSKNYTKNENPFGCFVDSNQSIELVIGDNIKYIGEYAFNGATGLKKVVIPDSVISIGVAAFYKCSNLTSVTIGNGCTSIGGSAFSKGAIRYVVMGSAIKTIGNYAFSGNNFDNGGYVSCLAVTPPTLSNAHVFDTGGTRPIYVPAGSVSKYKVATNWSYYSQTIVSDNDREQFITWSELKKLRDSGSLLPGKQYRITDYVTTTTQFYTMSAENMFDIIVTAISSTSLSEEAKATESVRDTVKYFKDSNLSAWKLWYCLDNDTARFAWADATNGNGVIYRMIDEHGNDCPYDFKNIMFPFCPLYVSVVDKYTDEDNSTVVENLDALEVGQYAVYNAPFTQDRIIGNTSLISYSATALKVSEPFNQDVGSYRVWHYTFNTYDGFTTTPSQDATIVSPKTTFDNKIEETLFNSKYHLPYITFNNTGKNQACWNNHIKSPNLESAMKEGGVPYTLAMGPNFHNNFIDRGAYNIASGNSFYNNKLEPGCHDIYVGDNCSSNMFGTHTFNVFMKNDCEFNTFGDDVNRKLSNNTTTTIAFDFMCQYNNVGDVSYSIDFGYSCCHNNLENSNNNIKFGEYCAYNKLYPHVKNIELPESSQYKIYIKGVNGDLVEAIANNELIVKITYKELVSLRNEGKLVPGAKYRITDYVTTTTQDDTMSAEHQFDVIVTALSENTLSEEAYAIKHEGDTYFNRANMSAWKLWYCLDNETNRFAWADPVNGKGVIYRMIDEHNNDCPYDFKNIMFLYGSIEDYYYTFALFGPCSQDISLTQETQVNDMYDSGGGIITVNISVKNNKIIREYNSFNRQLPRMMFYLNDGVDENIESNIVGDGCDEIIIYDGSFNKIGDECYWVSISGNENHIGNRCSDITLRGDRNKIGNDCDNISMGYGSNDNKIGDCCTLKFSFSGTYERNYCSNNTIANGCNVYLINNTTSNASPSTHLKNYYINTSGIFNVDTLGANYEIRIEKNSKGQVKQYCLADLID